QRELPDEEDIEVAALCEGFDDPCDPPEVDRILCGTTPDDDPDSDGPSGPRRYPMFCSQRFEDVHESGAVQHVADGYNPRREHAEAPRVQSTGQVLGEHGKALLGLVVARQSD